MSWLWGWCCSTVCLGSGDGVAVRFVGAGMAVLCFRYGDDVEELCVGSENGVAVLCVCCGDWVAVLYVR